MYINKQTINKKMVKKNPKKKYFFLPSELKIKQKSGAYVIDIVS